MPPALAYFPVFLVPGTSVVGEFILMVPGWAGVVFVIPVLMMRELEHWAAGTGPRVLSGLVLPSEEAALSF